MNSQMTQMNSNMASTHSVYLPCITQPSGHVVDVGYIKYLFENIWSMGEVNRVDIFDVVNENGTRAGNKRGAFVHMYHWDDNETTQAVMCELDTYGKCQMWLTYETKYGPGCYWIIKRMNREPVKETTMNVHQLADKLHDIEVKLQERNNEICELKLKLIEYNNNTYSGIINSPPMTTDELSTHDDDDELYNSPPMTTDELSTHDDDDELYNSPPMTTDELNLLIQ
jgi:hypothetical protein